MIPRPAWRIAKELGAELGVGDFFVFDTFEQYLATRLDGSGTTLESLKKKCIFFPKSEGRSLRRPATGISLAYSVGKS